MAFNVWFVIWPNQKRALGIVYCEPELKAKSAKIFKDARRRIVDDPKYIHMRKEWRQRENAYL